MIIFSHPPRKFGERGYFEAGRSDALMPQEPVNKYPYPRNLYAGGISLAPKIWITEISLSSQEIV